MGFRAHMQTFWNERLRQIIFASIPMIFFGIISSRLFYSNEPAWFAKLGAAMIAWAIFNLSLQRERYSRAMQSWDKVRSQARIDLIRQLDELRDQSLHLTFDLHASQIAQINHALGKDNPFVNNEKHEILQFCKNVQDRLEQSRTPDESRRLLNEIQQLEDDYQSATKEMTDWSRLIWRLEVALLLVGTLQNGYGDALVNWYHQN